MSASVGAQTSVQAKLPTAFERAAMSQENDLIDAKKKDDEQFFKRTLAPDFAMVGIDGQLAQGDEAGLGAVSYTHLVVDRTHKFQILRCRCV